METNHNKKNGYGAKPMNYREVLSNPELMKRIVDTHYHMGDFGYSGKKGCDTIRVLSESYGVSQNAVRETLKRARTGDLKDSYGNKVEAYSRKRTNDEVREVMELREKGMSYNAIASELNRSKTFVYNIVKGEKSKRAEQAKLAEERKQDIAYEGKLAKENGSMLEELNAEAAENYESYNVNVLPRKSGWFGKLKKHAGKMAVAAGVAIVLGTSAAYALVNFGADRAEKSEAGNLERKVAAAGTAEKKDCPILYTASGRDLFKSDLAIEEPTIENPVIPEKLALEEISDIPFEASKSMPELIGDAPLGGADVYASDRKAPIKEVLGEAPAENKQERALSEREKTFMALVEKIGQGPGSIEASVYRNMIETSKTDTARESVLDAAIPYLTSTVEEAEENARVRAGGLQ